MRSGLLFCFLLHFATIFSQEICTNGIDDDGDGLIDLNDPECICTVNAPTSLIPNHSFEQRTCCPSTLSQVDCLTGWIRPSGATPDYMNTCGFVGSCISQSPLGTFPDGNGAVGTYVSHGYNEYISMCLPAPLIAGTSYTIQMHCGMTGARPALIPCNLNGLPPLQWTVFGTSDCFDYAFFLYDCPMTSSMYVELGSAALVLDSQYHLLTITFTPTTNISVLTFGAPCSLPSTYPMNSDDCLGYVMMDNIILNTSDSFSLISAGSTGTFCENNLVVAATVSHPGGTFQWYHNGIAIAGQTDSTLHVSDLGLGAGTFEVLYDQSSSGCISATITLPEDTNGPAIDANDVSICPGESALLIATGSTNYSWSPPTGLSATTGTTVTANPSITTTYTISSTENGCTSTTTATVIVHSNPPLTVISEEICQGESFPFGTHFLTVAGTYNDTLASTTGCDSIVQLSLTVHPTIFTSLTHSMCQGESFPFGNQVLTDTGTYNDTLASATGCDSIVQLSLTVHPTIFTSLTHSMCYGESFLFGTHILTATGTYNDTLASVTGCDSIIQLNLTVFDPIDTTTTTNEITITASESNAAYQWLDCKNGSEPISGETNQSYTATTNGGYAVLITKNGCSDTSACITIATVGLHDLSDVKNGIVYPNPSTGLFHVLLDHPSTVTITNMFGMRVHTEVVQSSGQHIIDLQSQQNGIYFMQITAWDQTQTVTLVKY